MGFVERLRNWLDWLNQAPEEKDLLEEEEIKVSETTRNVTVDLTRNSKYIHIRAIVRDSKFSSAYLSLASYYRLGFPGGSCDRMEISRIQALRELYRLLGEIIEDIEKETA